MSGKYLRELRRAAGLRQSEVAKQSKLSAPVLCDIERGGRETTDDEVRHILRAIETLRAKHSRQFDRTAAKVREMLQREEAVA
jgi:transcriptional regulator with XRE-family HTH domain